MTQSGGGNPGKEEDWSSLFSYAPGMPDGTLPYDFLQFGVFTGPQNFLSNYDYDKVSKEGIWQTLSPGDFSFKKADIGAALFNKPLAYLGSHLDGIATSILSKRASFGPVPLYVKMIKQTINNGNVIANGVFIQNGLTTLNGNETVNGNIQCTGTVTAPKFSGKINQQSWKGFDIKHPKKDGYRLRHICVEGPEAAVYYRGTMKDTNVINLPEYWDGLVDIEKITVQLTPVGVWQDLYVEQIKWGKQVIVKSASGGAVNAYYTIMAPRLGELHVEYEGESASDYPGDQSEHSICGLHYDKR